VNFSDFALDAQIMAGVRDAGYSVPTPIQEHVIPTVLEGRDVIGLAQTGTGKTAAFVLPILQGLIRSHAKKSGPIHTLVLAPTRELAMQIHQEFASLGRKTGYRSAPVIGGVGQFPQVKALRRASICVACPGRLLDLLNQRQADLSHVNTLVLDEADRMLDMGFMPDIEKIMARLPERRQTLLFSATMPREIRGLAEKLMTDPKVVQIDNTKPAAGVSHALYHVDDSLKPALLLAMLENNETGNVLVFTRTKHRAKSLALKLCNKGWAATSLQGNLSQTRRQEALSGFKNGKYRIMVATDIAARGIDCKSISHVINYDVPDTAEAYTHRIGRTGRAERTGVAATLVTRQDLRQVRDIERTLGHAIERLTLDGFDYKSQTPASREPAPVHQRRPPRQGRGNGSYRPGKAPSRHA
jgi:ATP-dependent RNA helicase RhlE